MLCYPLKRLQNFPHFNLFRLYCAALIDRIFCRQDSFDSQAVCQLYSAVLDDFMTRRQSKIQHFILSDFVRNYPVISQNLVPDLMKFCGNAVQPYRRVRSDCCDLKRCLCVEAGCCICKAFSFSAFGLFPACQIIKRGELKKKPRT